MPAPRADIGALQAQIRAAGLDAVLTVSGANFTYVTDALMVIVPAEGAPLPLVCLPEAKQVRQDSRISDLRTYVEFKEDPMVVLAQLFAEIGLSTGRIGIESRFLAVTYERRLATALPEATITAADGVFDRARAVKTQTEIDILSAAR